MANGTLAASQIEMLSLSGTGIITITPPATNTNRAITLPDAAGALVVSGTTPSLNGITFPATQSASADANTLDDYEEGTYSVTDGSGAGLTFTNNTGRYVKIGGLVYFAFDINFPSTASTANIAINLPFVASNSPAQSVAVGYSGSGSLPSAYIPANTQKINIYSSTGVAVTNATFTTREFAIAGCYAVA